MHKFSYLFFGPIIASFLLSSKSAYAHYPHWHFEDNEIAEQCPDSVEKLHLHSEDAVFFLSEIQDNFEGYDGTWNSISDTRILSEATLVFGYLNAAASGVELCLQLQGADKFSYDPDPDFPIEPTGSPSHNHSIQDIKRNAYNNLVLINQRLNEL